MTYPSNMIGAALAIIGPLLPSELGCRARSAQDNRRHFNGLMWIMRTGSPGRHLAGNHGKWNSVYVQCRRVVETVDWVAPLLTLMALVITVSDVLQPCDGRLTFSPRGFRPSPKA